MADSDLRSDFWEDARLAATGFGLEIDPDCERMLRVFIDRGVGQLTGKSPRHVYQAETNLKAFVGGMAFHARLEQRSNLDGYAFEAARNAFCPLWPFC